MLTEQMLRQMWPNGDSVLPGLVTTIAANAEVIFDKYHIDSPMAVAHAMAQFTVECGGGHNLTENINYTAQRAVEVWPGRFSSAQDCYNKVGSFDGDPDFKFKLIDNVYGGRNGNTQPGDGSRYIGRGLSQCTGRGNYKKLADSLGTGLDLVGDPDTIIAIDNIFECGVADYVLHKCLPASEEDDIIEVSQRLNGGFVGFAERTQSLVKWKQALGVSPEKSGTMLWVQQSLNTLGASPPLVADSVYGPGSKAALKAFQASHHLTTQNGFPTRETMAAIRAAVPVG
jgi:putative chitinase